MYKALTSSWVFGLQTILLNWLNYSILLRLHPYDFIWVISFRKFPPLFSLGQQCSSLWVKRNSIVKSVQCPFNNHSCNVDINCPDNVRILTIHEQYIPLTFTELFFHYLLVNQITVSYFDPSFDKTHHVLILQNKCSNQERRNVYIAIGALG